MSSPFAEGDREPSRRRSGRSWALLWLPGLAVALGSAVATAHGLYEVAVAARVPAGIAWIYPLITDGLALVAYTATARLRGSAARYAWSVVVTAAGLSGLAQAVYLASDATGPGAASQALTIAPALRFGVGAWPAIAAATVAHLLYLLATADQDTDRAPGRDVAAAVSTVQPSTPTGPDTAPAIEAPEPEPSRALSSPEARPSVPADRVPDRAPVDGPGGGAESPVRDRARAVAARHAARHGVLPTVRELMTLADVSRGTAAAALKQLRDQPTALHLVPDTTTTEQTSSQP